MHFPTQAGGARALRMLTLSSVLVLAACGGGGGDSAEAPGEQPPPVVVPEQKRVAITGDNQLQVAGHAGITLTAMGPLAGFIANVMIPPPPGAPTLQRSATPSVNTAPAGARLSRPADLLAKSIRFFGSGNSASAALAVGVTTTETDTYAVECSSGSGTVTRTEAREEGTENYTRTTKAVMQNCVAAFDGPESAVVIDGEIQISEKGTYADGGYSFVGDIAAKKYSLKEDEIHVELDGDMHVESGEETYVSSGSRFSITGIDQIFLPGGEEEATPVARTYTMIDYRIATTTDEAGYTVTIKGTVETAEFGETAVFEVSTLEALRHANEAGAIVSGKYRIVGAEGTTLTITADGEGTFKLERDDKGDGSVEATVEGLTRDDLKLYFLFGFVS